MRGRSFLVWSVVFAASLAACAETVGELAAEGDPPDANNGATIDASAPVTADAASHTDATDAQVDAPADASSDSPDGADAGCPAPTTACGLVCANTAEDKLHCGGCDSPCLDGDGTAVCGSSQCGCSSGLDSYCAGAGCFDTSSNNQHCGPTCKTCQQNSTCSSGTCTCNGGFVECQPGVCSSLDTDSNCGRCGNVCGAGATCVGGKCRFSPTGSTCPPWGLAVGATTDSLYWTEFCGSAAAIRKCPLATGCATLPDALYSSTSGSLPCGIAAAKEADGLEYYFNTDNQYPNNYLWRSLNDGSGRMAWSGVSTGGPAALVSDGVSLWWGSGSGVYRSAVASTGSTLVLNANPSVLFGTGSTPQGVALDATNVYSGRQGVSGKADGVVACPIASDCSTTGEVQILAISNVTAIVSDGVEVFVSVASGTVDSVYRCPITGCTGTPTPMWTDDVGTSTTRHVPLAVDGTNVYVNSRNGRLFSCDKSQTTCTTPKLLHQNVHAGSMLSHASYVYWTESDGRGIYRTSP